MAAGETPSLTGEFTEETHRVLECTQTHPLGNQHQKGPIILGSWGSDWKLAERGASSTVPSQNLPHVQRHKAATWVALLLAT